MGITILDRELLIRLLNIHREKGETIVFTNGVFDLLHPGHVYFLRECKKLGDILVVGVNTDDSVKKIKGEKRPIYSLEERLILLEALEFVNYLIPFEEETPENLIRLIKPDILVKGEDYKNKLIVGKEFVESYGGKVVLIPLMLKFSTSEIIKKIKEL